MIDTKNLAKEIKKLEKEINAETIDSIQKKNSSIFLKKWTNKLSGYVSYSVTVDVGNKYKATFYDFLDNAKDTFEMIKVLL